MHFYVSIRLGVFFIEFHYFFVFFCCLCVCLLFLFFFFFSSRRRHTRCLSDWSSDVCSSDLPSPALRLGDEGASVLRLETGRRALAQLRAKVPAQRPRGRAGLGRDRRRAEIGRASCRERV